MWTVIRNSSYMLAVHDRGEGIGLGGVEVQRRLPDKSDRLGQVTHSSRILPCHWLILQVRCQRPTLNSLVVRPVWRPRWAHAGLSSLQDMSRLACSLGSKGLSAIGSSS